MGTVRHFVSPNPGPAVIDLPALHQAPTLEDHRILLVDDQTITREALRHLFEAQTKFEEVLEASDLATAFTTLAVDSIDLVLVNSSVGPAGVIDFVFRLRRSGTSIPILVLLGTQEKEFGPRVLEAGATGVVSKLITTGGLIWAVRAACRGVSWQTEPSFRPPEFRIPALPRKDLFTDRQRHVLRGVLQGYGNKEIAGKLQVTEASVKCTVQQLFAKTCTHSRAQLVRVLLEKFPSEVAAE